MQHMIYGNTVISYSVKYSSKRKTMSIQVSEKGVTIIAPSNTAPSRIEEILQKKATWIIKQLADFEEIYDYEEKLQFQAGEKLPYLGRHYRLKIIKDNVPTAALIFKQGKFIATIPSTITVEDHREILYPLYKEWVMKKAEKIAMERVKRFERQSTLKAKSIKIKDQQQRWGSCTARGNIILNWKIFLAPMPIVDYVIAHELAHLKHLDHSPAYWETLQMIYPEYENSKEWLRLNGRKLEF
ncbi:M48 family metallopeptidase [Lysinibacillus xylanilyticus]|uniref:M48 family metallopeptidase n=1 Tax=Lysinibacillus xylanilyticus TaxID=582475 RepID=UPI003D9844F9